MPLSLNDSDLVHERLGINRSREVNVISDSNFDHEPGMKFANCYEER
jgi:hypothetical protein